MSILHFIRAGGWVMIPLLALSLAAGVVIIERLLAFRQMGSLAPGLLPRVVALCENRKYDEALSQCRAQEGPLARCLAVVIEHRGQPMARVERLVEEAGQEYFLRLEKMLPFLDTTTTISPLMGLLGTIIGMIGAFNAISANAVSTQGRGSTDAVLGGVAEALYATATGITIAIICFVSYNGFASRLRNITAETEMAATKLINLLSEQHFPENPSPETLRAKSSTRLAANEVVSNGVQKVAPGEAESGNATKASRAI